MNYLKPAITGILFGAAIFFFTFFILRVIAFVLIISLLFRLFTGRRFHGGWGRSNNGFYADSIRSWGNENNGRGWKQRNKSSLTEIEIA